MAKNKIYIQTALKKATIELLLLKLLNEGDMYGYQLSQELKKRSDGRYAILEGSMYPILYRLTENGYISSYEKKVGVRQVRVYYHLESAGKKHMLSIYTAYRDYISLIDYLLSSHEGDVYEKLAEAYEE